MRKQKNVEFTEFVQSSIHDTIIQAELERSFPYFKTLDALLQQRFIARTSFFIKQKKFVARKDLQMTDTVRVLVSACAVQVTFGLDTYTLDTFEYVVIYPDIYESPLTKKMHKGETNLSGFICLSWKHILEGIKNPNDNYNLGLHEWTHALRFNSINFEETDYFFDGYINKWVANALPEFTHLKNGGSSIFRRYGAANIHEFLSVSTEHFFESPDEFKLKAPAFFDQMCILFNQLPGKETKINVRNALLGVDDFPENDKPPVLILEASFFRTLFNMGLGLLYFIGTLFLLFSMGNVEALVLGISVCMCGVIIMNNKYFTIKFYDEYIYLQSGFFSSLNRKLRINYNSLIKLEIFEGNYDNNSFGTVFQLNYYNGSKFLKRTAYCSAIDVPQEKILTLMKQKKVGVMFPG